MDRDLLVAQDVSGNPSLKVFSLSKAGNRDESGQVFDRDTMPSLNQVAHWPNQPPTSHAACFPREILDLPSVRIVNVQSRCTMSRNASGVDTTNTPAAVQDIDQSQIMGKRHPCPCIRQLTNHPSAPRIREIPFSNVRSMTQSGHSAQKLTTKR